MSESIMIIGSRKPEAGSRKPYLDFLRVAACFAVMVHHVAAYSFKAVDVNTFEWNAINVYSGLARFAVPIFVMISGVLFLDPDKDIPIRKIYSKYILRIAIAFAFWTTVYAVKIYLETGDILKASASLIGGRYHMWFLFMITGLYMILPFTRVIAGSEFLTKYFLVLVLIFSVILPEPARIISVFSEKYSHFAEGVVNNFHMQFTAGFTGYFLLGYVLDKIHVSPKLERIIYAAGIIGVSAIISMSAFASMYRHEVFTLYNAFSVPFICAVIAVFIFFKEHFDSESKLVRLLSQYSFGAYLVHDAALDFVNQCGLNALTFNPMFSMPITASTVFVISFSISAVLNHIPVLKKYIV